jgi:2,3-bisphosphoglycerate-dependent phosphoglycerate mutase
MSHRLTFLRHGQSVANHDGIVQGHLDSPLSALGREQAEALAAAWGPEPLEFDLILSSPLKRASETASILSDHLGVPVQLEPQWMERDLGHAQGTRVQDFLSASRDRPARPPFTAAYDDGEGTWDLYLRAAGAVQSVVRRPAGRYLIVSHGGILNAALRVILGIAPAPGHAPRFELGNCGYTHLSMDAGGAWTFHALCNPPDLSSPDEAER